MKLALALLILLSPLLGAASDAPGLYSASQLDRDHDGVMDAAGAYVDGVANPQFSVDECLAQGPTFLKPVDCCVGSEEDIDGFEDHDGCLDLDHDGDGLPRGSGESLEVDECESLWGPPSAGGCPAEWQQSRWALYDGARCRLHFLSGSTNISTQESNSVSRCAGPIEDFEQLAVTAYGFASDLPWGTLDEGASRKLNEQLSCCRARAATEHLGSLLDRKGAQLHWFGCGEVAGDAGDRQMVQMELHVLGKTVEVEGCIKQTCDENICRRFGR